LPTCRRSRPDPLSWRYALHVTTSSWRLRAIERQSISIHATSFLQPEKIAADDAVRGVFAPRILVDPPSGIEDKAFRRSVGIGPEIAELLPEDVFDRYGHQF
jgi:hypothetical protein